MKAVGSVALALGLWVASALPSLAVAAQVVGGVTFDDRCEVAGKSLVLNGAGLRTKLIIKVYAVGLYLPGREQNPGAVLAQQGPKSVHITMLRDVRGSDLSEALVKGMVANLSPKELMAMQSRLDDLHTALMSAGDAKKGDVIQLDYLPGTGAHLTLAGKPLSKDIPGEDFYQGLLKIWIGEKVSDKGLKSELLGQAR
ncbi:chalcone isomerase family protein [Aquabacterium sp.]|uniref:chalcone isomerase family protein n=1 Tax=Aquabacterium sp. TaxID=1872578 RepID=UPI003D6C773B